MHLTFFFYDHVDFERKYASDSRAVLQHVRQLCGPEVSRFKVRYLFTVSVLKPSGARTSVLDLKLLITDFGFWIWIIN